MYVDVDLAQDPVTPRLLEPEDFKAFKLIARGDVTAAALERGLGDLGSVTDDGAHAWLKVDGLRDLAGEVAGTSAWSERFDGMVGYADSKGWLSPGGDAIRAHVEHVDPSSPAPS